MPAIRPNRRLIIILLFFSFQLTALTLLGLGNSVALANIPPVDTPTDTPTDTSTPPPAKLIGQIDLQGRQEHPKPATPWAIPVTVELIPAIGGASKSVETTTDENGKFVVEDIEPGTYNIRVKGFNTLRNLAQGVTLEPGGNIYFFDFDLLLAGDVEQAATFNQVFFEDFSTLLAVQGKCEGDAGFDDLFDLYVNGCVDLPDFGILSGNFNKTGDVSITALALPNSLEVQDNNSIILDFDPAHKEVGVGENATVLLKVTPCCNEQINGVEFTLSYSPTLIYVNDVMTATLPHIISKTVDNQQGKVYFSTLMTLGEVFTETTSVAQLSFKVVTDTAGAVITPANFIAVDSGGLITRATKVQGFTVTAQNKGTCGAGYCYYFPIIFKEGTIP